MNKTHKQILKYTNIPTPGKFKISPSAFAGHFISPGDWYTSQIEKQSKFKGNKKTCLGTLLHSRAELWYDQQEFNYKVEQDYIDSFSFTEEQARYVTDNLEPMWSAFNEYLFEQPRPDLIEPELTFTPEWSQDVAMAGSADAVYFNDATTNGGIIVDYKSIAKKPSRMDPAHFAQALLYASALKQKGHTINTVRIIYIQTPLKTVPARIHVIDEPITQLNYHWADHQMRIIAKRIQMVKEDPSLQDVIFNKNPASYYNDEKENPLKAFRRTEPSDITFNTYEDLI